VQQGRKPVAVGLGEVLWDMLPGKKQFGGAPANFAYHAKTLGADAYVVSCVGDDPLGREILDRLDSLELNRDCVAVDREHPTGTVSVKLDAGGKPTYTIHEGVAWDCMAVMPGLVELAGRAEAVCFGSLAQRSAESRATIRCFLAATTADCLRIFDINLRQHYYDAETVDASLEAANVLKLNDEELPVLAELLWCGSMQNEERVMNALLERYELRLIALTKGPAGSLLLAPGQSSTHGGFATAVADTVGAGDAFTAVLAMGLIDGVDLESVNERANRIAAYVCSRPGATPDMPDELTRRS